MKTRVTLRPAGDGDAAPLAAISRRSFDSDAAFGAPPGGPPGYTDPEWIRRMMSAGEVLVIEADGSAVGGAVVFDCGTSTRELGRIFIDPDHHRRGVGSAAIEQLARRHPDTRRWILDTPAWNPRTRAFYERIGFVEYGRRMLDEGWELVLYERVTADADPGASPPRR